MRGELVLLGTYGLIVIVVLHTFVTPLWFPPPSPPPFSQYSHATLPGEPGEAWCAPLTRTLGMMGHGEHARYMRDLRGVGCVDAVIVAANKGDPHYTQAVLAAGILHGSATPGHAQSLKVSQLDENDVLEATVAGVIANAPWIRKVVVLTPTVDAMVFLKDAFGDRVRLVSYTSALEGLVQGLGEAPGLQEVVSRVQYALQGGDGKVALPPDSPLPIFNPKLIKALVPFIPRLAPAFLILEPGVVLTKPTGLSRWWNREHGLRVPVDPRRLLDQSTLDTARRVDARTRASDALKPHWRGAQTGTLSLDWESMYSTRRILFDASLLPSLGPAMAAYARQARDQVASTNPKVAAEASHHHNHDPMALFMPVAAAPTLLLREPITRMLRSSPPLTSLLVSHLFWYPFEDPNQLHIPLLYTYGMAATFSPHGLRHGTLDEPPSPRTVLDRILSADPNIPHSWLHGYWSPRSHFHAQAIDATLRIINAYVWLPHAIEAGSASKRGPFTLSSESLEDAQGRSSQDVLQVLIEIPGLAPALTRTFLWWDTFGSRIMMDGSESFGILRVPLRSSSRSDLSELEQALESITADLEDPQATIDHLVRQTAHPLTSSPTPDLIHISYPQESGHLPHPQAPHASSPAPLVRSFLQHHHLLQQTHE